MRHRRLSPGNWPDRDEAGNRPNPAPKPTNCGDARLPRTPPGDAPDRRARVAPDTSTRPGTKRFTFRRRTPFGKLGTHGPRGSRGVFIRTNAPRFAGFLPNVRGAATEFFYRD